jgi:ATP-dependent Lon protease
MTVENIDKDQPGYKAFMDYIHDTYSIEQLERHVEVSGTDYIKIKYDHYLDYLKDNVETIEIKDQTENTVFLVDKKLFDEKIDVDGDSQIEEKYHSLLEKCEPITEAKILAPFPSDTHEKLIELKQKYPHCSDIIDLIDAQIHLQTYTDKPYAKIPHMIFDGDPGSGKTSLARHIAEIISPEYFYIDLSLYSEAFQIAGLSIGYSSGDCGLMVKHTSESKYANNLYICDEAEKTRQDKEHSSPLVPLYQLLEYDTAKHFTDVALEIPVDMSYNSFILTTNDVDFLPEAIRSRCLIFNVPQPSKKMIVEKIAPSAWDDILSLESWGSAFETNLSLDVRQYLGKISVREVKKQLKIAAANAPMRHSDPESKIKLLLKDFMMAKLKKTKNSIGFINN